MEIFVLPQMFKKFFRCFVLNIYGNDFESMLHLSSKKMVKPKISGKHCEHPIGYMFAVVAFKLVRIAFFDNDDFERDWKLVMFGRKLGN